MPFPRKRTRAIVVENVVATFVIISVVQICKEYFFEKTFSGGFHDERGAEIPVVFMVTME